MSDTTEKAIKSLNYYAAMPPSQERAAGLLTSALWYAATVLKRDDQDHKRAIKFLALRVETMIDALQRSKDKVH